MQISLMQMTYAMACIFGAAVIRGYSGFGFSMLAIVSLSLVMPPAEVIPSVFILEIAASLHLLPGVWRHIHWRSLGWLTTGCLIGTPIGVYALAHSPAAPMTLALSVFVIIAALLLARGFAISSLPGPATTCATGVASGLFNGGFGMGGPPVILFFFSSPAGIATGRASLIAYFLITDLTGLAWQSFHGLLAWPALGRAIMFLPALIIGVWIGNRGFLTAEPTRFRHWVLRLLIALGLICAGRALVQLLST